MTNMIIQIKLQFKHLKLLQKTSDRSLKLFSTVELLHDSLYVNPELDE